MYRNTSKFFFKGIISLFLPYFVNCSPKKIAHVTCCESYFYPPRSREEVKKNVSVVFFPIFVAELLTPKTKKS